MCVTVAALINYQAGGESTDKDRLAENLISDMRALGPWLEWRFARVASV